METREFKIGQWWRTRAGEQVLIWNTESTSLGVDRPIQGVFYKSGTARWPGTGYWSQNGAEGCNEDLMHQCEAPEEFK